jgi:hypothetical protein
VTHSPACDVGTLVAAVRGVGYEVQPPAAATPVVTPGDLDLDFFSAPRTGEGGVQSPPWAPVVGQCQLAVGGMSCMRNCGTKVLAALRSVAGVQGLLSVLGGLQGSRGGEARGINAMPTPLPSVPSHSLPPPPCPTTQMWTWTFQDALPW